MSALKDYISPTFVHPDPWPPVKFPSNLDQAYDKEADEFANPLESTRRLTRANASALALADAGFLWPQFL